MNRVCAAAVLRMAALSLVCLSFAGCAVSDAQDFQGVIPPGKGILLVSVDTDSQIKGLVLTNSRTGWVDLAYSGIPLGRSMHTILLPAGDYAWTRVDLESVGFEERWVDLTQQKGISYSFTVKAGAVNYPGDLQVNVQAPELGGIDVATHALVTGDRYRFELVDRAAMVLTWALAPGLRGMIVRQGMEYTGPGSDEFPAYFSSLSAPGAAAPAASTVSAPPAATAGIVPVADFFRNAPIAKALLSPDGRLVLMVIRSRETGLRKLTLIDLDKHTLSDVYQPFDPREEFSGIEWVSDDTFVFMHTGDLPGDGALTAIRWQRDSKGEPTLQQKRWSGSFWMVDPHLHGGGHVLLGEMYRSDQQTQECMLTADVVSGPQILEFNACDVPLEEGTIGTLSDNEGKLRVVARIAADKLVHFSRPTMTGDGWKEFKAIDPLKEHFWPIAVAEDGHDLLVLSNRDRSTDGLFEYAPDSDKLVRTLFANDDADVADWHFDATRRKLVYLTWYAGGEPHYEVLDTVARNAMPALDQAFPGQTVVPWSFSDDGKRALVYVYDDTYAGGYYAFDSTTHKSVPLGDRKPWIKPHSMAHVKVGTLKTQDGLDVGYLLTLPVIKAARYPLVVIPHGGPIGVFDDRTFDPEAQLLASRGYAVLKINYRGSGANGLKFEEAGKRQWGLKIEDDISAVVHSLLRTEPLDEGRLCIFGASYGGYSALISAIREPALYKCAASLAGVTDIPLLYDTSDVQQDAVVRKAMVDLIGDPTTDADKLRSVSPVYLADKVQCPVLIAQGEKDTQVDLEQAYRMKVALEALHKPVVYLTYSRMGHGFDNPAAEADFYTKLLAFLDANIGPGNRAP